MVFALNAQISTNEKPISFDRDLIFKNTKVLSKFSKPDLRQVFIEDSILSEYPEVPERFSVPIDVNLTTENAGDWTTIDSFNVWQLQINVDAAKAITLAYDKFWLPDGAKLFIYSKDRKHVLGAFTSLNNNKNEKVSGFVTGFIKGDDVIIEYYEPQHIKNKGIISISRIGYVYKNLALFNYENTVVGFGNSLSCHININCPEGNNWQEEKRAVSAYYNIYDGTGLCSGALVNNTSNDRTPYYLTANHCFNGPDSEGNNNLWQWVFYWNYESSGCNNGNNFTPPSTQGAIMKANNSYTDFALLELSDDPKNITGYIPYYLGWTRSTTPATSATGIHHPKGDIKKISIDNHQANIYNKTINWSGGTPSQPNTHWKVTFDIGAIEKGSSGSPLMDQNHRIIGQLHGGGIVCAPVDSYYGRFDLSWDYGSTSSRRLKDWLDPTGVNSQTLDGINTFSISGPTTLCSQGVYTIDNLPSGAPVSWQVGSGLSVSTSQNTATVTATGSGISSWIKAQVTVGSKIFDLPQKNIWVGSTTSSITGPQHVPNGGNEYYYAISSGDSDNVSYQWSITPSIPFTASGSSMSVNFPYTNADYSIKLTTTNSCGSTVKYHYVATGAYEPDRVYPNPSSDMVHVNLNGTVGEISTPLPRDCIAWST